MEIDDMTDKELILELMKVKGWTQVQITQQLGLKAQSHISSIINGKGKLGGSTRKLAEVLLEPTVKDESTQEEC